MINLRDEDIELLNYSYFIFDVDESVENSISTLEKISSQHTENICEFNDDNWTIIYKNGIRKFDFNFHKSKTVINEFNSIGNLSPTEFLDILKCWICTLLEQELDLYSIHRYLRYVTEFLKYSNGFDVSDYSVDKSYNSLIEIESSTVDKSFIICIGVLNLLDYCEEIDQDDIYLNLLVELKNSMDSENKVRTLPHPRDVFLFDKYFNRFFEEKVDVSIKTELSALVIYYFPVYLWWRLTNIIPLRPSEFCAIKRDGLEYNENKYYINLPRSNKKGRSKNRNRIQIITRLEIPNDIGKAIQNYIDTTDSVGSSETLLSYKAHKTAYKKVFETNYKMSKLNENIFTILNLNKNIQDFYKYILGGHFGLSINQTGSHTAKKPNGNGNHIVEDLNKYSIGVNKSDEKDNEQASLNKRQSNYDINKKITPGDTRHFAFINLMRLGYNPIEIARLGGHTKLNAQYHYHHHKEYLLDIEVLNLMNNLPLQHKNDFNNTRNSSNTGSFSNQFDEDSKTFNTISNVLVENFNIESIIEDQFIDDMLSVPTVTSEFTGLADNNVRKQLLLGYCTDPYQRCLVSDCLLCDYWKISYQEFENNKNIIMKKVQIVYEDVSDIISTIQHIHKHIIESYNRDESEIDLDLNFNKDLVVQSMKLKSKLKEYIQLLTIQNGKVVENE